jgi:phosphatidylserine synthase
MIIDNDEASYKNNYWPVILWWIFTVLGITLKITHISSSVVLVIGFAGLAVLSTDYVILRKSRSVFFLITLLLCIAFLIMLIIGAFLNQGYPINYKGVIVYGVVFLPGIIWRTIEQRRKSKQPND